MSQPIVFRIAAAGLLILAGLFSFGAGSIWPLLVMAALLTLLFRFRPKTRAIGLAAETLAIALAAIFVLDGLGVTIIFVYKSFIAVLLFLLILLERDQILRTLSQRGGLYANIRLVSLAAVAGVAVVAVGHFLYRGESFAMVRAPLEVLVLVGIGWALLNSISEEFIYRGVLYARLRDTAGASWAVAGQAVIFGVAHLWTKVPLGAPGVILSFLFALSLGWLVRRTGSLAAVVFVHFWVDLALFFTVLLRQ